MQTLKLKLLASLLMFNSLFADSQLDVIGPDRLASAAQLSAVLPLRYESLEHKFIASRIRLKFPDSVGGYYELTGNQAIMLSYPNDYVAETALAGGVGFTVSFADMVYLSGDYLANPAVLIANNNYEQGKRNFLLNFASYLSEPSNSYIYPVMQIVQQEESANSDNILQRREIVIPATDSLRLNCATGGGCASKFDLLLRPGLYFKILTHTFDHFGKDAQLSYLIGHRLALETAYNATSLQQLVRAYAYEAYADHLLSDLFAAGHLRTQFKELKTICDDPAMPNFLTQLLGMSFAHIMHNRDNKQGIIVIGNDASHWRAYGDAELFLAKNNLNLNLVMRAMQAGADQVYASYNAAPLRQTAQRKWQAKPPQLDQFMYSQWQLLPDSFATYNYVAKDTPNKLFMVKNNLLYEDQIGRTNCLSAFIRHYQEIFNQ